MATISADPNRTYLVECFAPGPIDEILALADRLRAATAATAGRHDIDYLGAMVVAGDEIVFYVFRARAVANVRDLLDRLPLAFERIVESVVVPAEALTSPVAPLGAWS